MKNFKHEFKEWLVVAAQGSIFIVMFLVFIFAAMSAGCGGQETVRPVVDAEEVQDTEDFDEVVDETADEDDFEGVDAEDVDSDEVTDEEDSDIEAPDEEEDSDEVPDEVVQEGWMQVITARSAGSPFRAVSCGIYKKQLYCWGNNEDGNFGNGTKLSSNKPVLAGGSLYWNKVVLNVSRTFGIDTEGFLYAWGGNWYHNINLSDQQWILEPFKMSHIKFVDISIITDFLCGLTANGQEWCQDSVTTEMVLKREGITGYWPDVAPGVSFMSRSAKVGLLEGGRVTAYTGYAYKDWPNPLRNISDISLLTQIDGELLGGNGSGRYCATDLNKELWCWSTDTESYPNKHEGDYTFWYGNMLSGVTNFSKAPTHTCAVTTAGKLYCWGGNKEGQLGLGYASETTITEPQEVIIY